MSGATGVARGLGAGARGVGFGCAIGVVAFIARCGVDAGEAPTPRTVGLLLWIGITGVVAVTFAAVPAAAGGGRFDFARAGSGGGFDDCRRVCPGCDESKRCVSGSGSRSVAGGGTDAMRDRIAGGGGTASGVEGARFAAGGACGAMLDTVSTACPLASRSGAPINVDFTDASGMLCVMYGAGAPSGGRDGVRDRACGGAACGGDAPGTGGGREDFICAELVAPSLAAAVFATGI